MGILRKIAEKLDQAADRKTDPIVNEVAPRPEPKPKPKGDGKTGGAR